MDNRGTKEGLKSPYSEPLARPRSASSARGSSTERTRLDTQRQAKQWSYRSKSARNSRSKTPACSSDNRKSGKKKRNDDKAEKEIKMVSKQVRDKLELYLNREKRESRFQPQGAITTTRKMAPFDVAYRILEYDIMEKKSPRYQKVSHKTKDNGNKRLDPYTIDPALIVNSRRVTQFAEADRYSQFASQVFASYPIDQLSVIHRYRPDPKEGKKCAENGNIHGYTGHVGAALHQKTYVDFYLKEGFNSKPNERSAKQSTKKSHRHGSYY